MEKPILIYHKKIEKTTRKLLIPKYVVEQWGNEYYMEIYEDKVILRPVGLEQKQEKMEE